MLKRGQAQGAIVLARKSASVTIRVMGSSGDTLMPKAK